MARVQSIATGERQPIHLHMLAIGGKSVGKTTFGTTWPNPYFICCAAEHGAETIHGLYNYTSVDLWEDFEEEVTDIEAAVRQGRWLDPRTGQPYRTLVIDATSTIGLLCEQWSTRKMKGLTRGDENAMDARRQQMWGYTKDAFLGVLLRVHALPVHVLWLGHAKDVTVSDKKGNEHVVARRLDFPGSGRDQLVRDVFAYIGLSRRTETRNGVSTRVVTAQLAPDGMGEYGFRRDGFLDRAPTTLPSAIESPSFGAIAYYLGACGVAVYDAPLP